MKAYDVEHSSTPYYHSKNVAVLGGGNVAMDSARMAIRLGAGSANGVGAGSAIDLGAGLAVGVGAG